MTIEWMRTKPDEGRGDSQFSGVQQDSIEASARDGSPSIFTRTGGALYVDSFECCLSPWIINAPNDAEISIDDCIAFHGCSSLKLIPQSASEKEAGISKVLPTVKIVPRPTWGIEFFVNPSADNMIDIQAEVQSPTFSRFFQVRIYAGNGNVEVKDDAPGWVWIEDSSPGALWNADPIFWLFKLRFDTESGKYIDFRINDIVWDLTQYTGRARAPAYPGRVDFKVIVRDQGTNQQPMWIDALTITVDDGEHVR